MPIHELGSHVRLRVLLLDIIESLGLVPVQGLLDVFETGGLGIVDVVGKNNSILHCVHSPRPAAWEELVGGYRNTIAKVGMTGEKG
jgi:hypothetical protein